MSSIDFSYSYMGFKSSSSVILSCMFNQHSRSKIDHGGTPSLWLAATCGPCNFSLIHSYRLHTIYYAVWCTVSTLLASKWHYATTILLLLSGMKKDRGEWLTAVLNSELFMHTNRYSLPWLETDTWSLVSTFFLLFIFILVSAGSSSFLHSSSSFSFFSVGRYFVSDWHWKLPLLLHIIVSEVHCLFRQF